MQDIVMKSLYPGKEDRKWCQYSRDEFEINIFSRMKMAEFGDWREGGNWCLLGATLGVLNFKNGHQMPVSISSNGSFYTLLLGTRNGSATFKNNLATSYKVIQTWPSNHTHRYLPKRNVFFRMFLTARFIVFKNWKQFRLSTYE